MRQKKLTLSLRCPACGAVRRYPVSDDSSRKSCLSCGAAFTMSGEEQAAWGIAREVQRQSKAAWEALVHL